MPFVVELCHFTNASSYLQRNADGSGKLVSTKMDQIMLTLRCRSCQVHVTSNTTICATLYHTALELVASLKSL